MTLEEAIKHCEEKEKEQALNGCFACAEEHKQLAEWLKELKDYREGTRTCENCKHEHKAETEYPCSICRCNHVNKFEWKDGAK